MSSSDSVAGAQEQTSSEFSLETTLGAKTEVGKSTVQNSSSSSSNPGLSDPTLGSTSESSRHDTPPLVEMESEVQGQLLLPPSLVARPTATAQAIGAQLEQPRREKVTAPSQAEPLPAGLVAASSGQAAPPSGDFLLQALHQMQRQEQQHIQMQQQMQAAQEAQTQLLTLLAQYMQQDRTQQMQQGAAQLVAAPPPGGGLATRGRKPETGNQNPWAETQMVTPPQTNTCQECRLERPHVCLYRSQRDEMSKSGRTIHSHPLSHPPSPPLTVVNQRARTDVWVENLDRIEVVSSVIQRQE